MANVYLNDKFGFGKVCSSSLGARCARRELTAPHRRYLSSVGVLSAIKLHTLNLLPRLGAIIQMIAYILLGTGGPFPLMCLAFGMIGFALSLQNAQANGFVGSLKNHPEIKMSFLHASYGGQSRYLHGCHLICISRNGCFRRSPRSDAILYPTSLVSSLSHFLRHQCRECCSFVFCFPLQNSRWYD